MSKLLTIVRESTPFAVASIAVAGFLLTIFHTTTPTVHFNASDISNAGFAEDFHLTDVNGSARSIADYRGNVVMVFFGYTQCASACPTELARSVEVMRILGPKADHVRMLFITVDPERDSPDLIRNYVHAFDASFTGLYGDLKTTAATAQEFKVFYQKVPAGKSYTMDHSAFTYIFDQTGHVRLMAKPELEAEALASDIKNLLQVGT